MICKKRGGSIEVVIDSTIRQRNENSQGKTPKLNLLVGNIKEVTYAKPYIDIVRKIV